MRNIKQTSGFTLIELMVTLAVLGTMVAIGIPQFNRMTETNRVAGSINALASDLKLARSESAKRNKVVTVCASIDRVSCSNTANWHEGWIVFSDQNKNNAVDGTDVIVSVKTKLNAGLAFTDTGFTSAGIVQYTPSGALLGNGGTLKLCETAKNDPKRARGITINNQGRSKSAKDNSGNNIREDINGVDFVCP